MRNVVRLGVFLPAMLLAPVPGAAAYAEASGSGTLNLRYDVPVLCRIDHRAGLAPAGAGYQLGALREFCNAATGYTLMVSYAPGTMRGSVVAVGDDRVVLTGTGRDQVASVRGPRIRERAIYAQPGPAGFDTDRLDFDIVAH